VPARLVHAQSVFTDGMNFRIELFVDDLDRSIRFYEDALGFQLPTARPRASARATGLELSH
jgi:predicted enzyme related to lactoylglutathione lyase